MSENGTLVLASMRDEGPYLLEWIAHYRLLGFEAFLIYSNDCRDGTDHMLDRLETLGIITHVRTNVLRRGPQRSAYRAAVEHEMVRNARWVLACDADELLCIRAGDGKIGDLIAQFPDADAIPICWRMFSNAGNVGLVEGLTSESYTDAQPDFQILNDKARFVKTLFRSQPTLHRLGYHAPEFDGTHGEVKIGASWTDKPGETNPWRPLAHFGYDIAQMNHYAVRSVDNFLLKRDRGDAQSRKDRLTQDYWERWCVGGQEDRTLADRVPQLQVELDKLLADPILAALDGAARELRRQRLAELHEMPEFQELREDILAIETARAKAARPEPAPKPEPVAAPIGRVENRLRMLESMPKGGRCAEIGVWNGGFSESILAVTEPSELVLIDPWDLLSDRSEDEQTHGRHEDHDFMRGMYDQVVETFGKNPNVTIERGFSAEVLERYPDNYFDWVYIDGNHLYDFVRGDIAVSFRKVRPGGIIAGDDFFWAQGGRMHVKEAVIDEMKAQGCDRSRPRRMGQQYLIDVA